MIKAVTPAEPGVDQDLMLLATRLLIVVDVLRDPHPNLVPIVQDAASALRRYARTPQECAPPPETER